MLIAALVAVIGGHWAILQSIAWANMLADNLQTNNFAEAISKTFDGDHPCRMCKAISKERKSEKKPDTLETKVRKLEFTRELEHLIITPPGLLWLLPPDTFAFEKLSLPPPLPPPRQVTV